MPPWAGGGSPGVPAFACCRPHWALPQSHGAAIVAARDAAVARLTRNAVQLRKLFFQASRAAAGLLVVVFAMTGAAKLAIRS
jgi:hypothetical protein